MRFCAIGPSSGGTAALVSMTLLQRIPVLLFQKRISGNQYGYGTRIKPFIRLHRFYPVFI